MTPAEFSDEVAELKREIARLQAELKVADAAGDRRRALVLLARMLELQGTFFRRWQASPGRPEPR